MHRGEPPRRRTGDWPSRDRDRASSPRGTGDRPTRDRGRVSSPRGSSTSRSESGRKDEEPRSTWSSEIPRDSRTHIKWGHRSSWHDDSGRGESSRSGHHDSISTSRSWVETTSNHSSRDIESSSRPTEGRNEPTNGDRSKWSKPPPFIAPRSPPPPRLPPPRSPPPPRLPPPRSPLPPRLPPPRSPPPLRPGSPSAQLQPVAKEPFPPASTPRKPEDDPRSAEHEKLTSVPKLTVPASGNKRKHYWNRLTLLSEAVLLRNEYTEVTRALEARRKMRNTIRYSHVSENVNSKLNAFTQEYENKSKELKTKMDRILSKLVDADIMASGTSDDAALAMDQASLRHLQTRLDQLEGMVQRLTVEANRWGSQSQEQHDERLSVGQKRPSESSEDHAESNDGLLKRLEQLEMYLTDMDNQATQRTDHVIDILDVRLDQRMSEPHLGNSGVEDGKLTETITDDSQPGPGTSQPKNSLREQVAKLTHDHDEFAEETANLITKHAQASAEIRTLQAENIALKEALLGYQSSLHSVQDIAIRNERQVQALVAAIKVIREQSLQPPPPMDIHVLDPIRKRILQDVLSSVNASLLAFRAQCEEALLSTREETLKQIVAKFGPTMDLVNVIHEYFKRDLEMENGFLPLT